MRITKKQLENKVEYLNEITGNEVEPWKRIDGKNIASVGTYYLDGAYGGYKLVKIVNTGGGVTSITHGYISKRELASLIDAYISGIQWK